MKYVLTPTSSDSRERILRDAALAGPERKRIANFASDEIFTRYWVHDEATGNYLIYLPQTIREESNRSEYLAFIAGQLYLVEITDFFGNDTIYRQIGGPNQVSKEAVRAELMGAFKIHGRYATSPGQEFIPNFVGRQ